jgi:hypothetical protein
MPSLSRTAKIAAPAERVFAYIDDIRNLARHMSERRSMAMMGSKLKLEILSPEPTGIGATYRYSGRMIGLDLAFSETVTRYIPGREKVWHTVGTPRLLIIESYEMAVTVVPEASSTSRLTIRIDYELPKTGVWSLIGWLAAPSYASWCLNSMVDGTKSDLEGLAA